MSARGLYLAPVADDEGQNARSGADGGGFERRSRHPLDQLGRALNRLCLEAADPFEIAAHLEALGFNTARTALQYGVTDHFELAQELFHRTPRRLRLQRPSPELRRSFARQVAMVITLFVTGAVGLFAEAYAWGPVLWLLIWSQLGAALLGRAQEAGGDLHHRRTLSLVLELGVLGLVAVWFVTPFSLATWTVSALWLGIAGLLWGGKPRRARLLPLVAALLLGLHVVGAVPLAGVLAGSGFATVLALRSLFVWSTPESWRWAVRQGRYLLPFVLYGLGQGLLLLALLGDAGEEALPGVVLFALILFAAEPGLLRFRAVLGRCLWRESDPQRYAATARRAVLGYAGAYLLAFAPALLVWWVWGLHPWLAHLAGFALFGLVLALGLALLSLGDSRVPALLFLLGGALVTAGLPFFAVASGMVITQLVTLMERSTRLGKHGVYLL